jgi:CubicO group peptidase (beta-lactamase class C family)
MLPAPDKSREGLTPGALGRGGAWGTIVWIDPTERTVMVFLTQVTTYGHLNVRQDFPNMVMQAITESHRTGRGGIGAYEPIPRN